MGKGDGRRPTLISEEEAQRRWEQAFGGADKRDGKNVKRVPLKKSDANSDEHEIDWDND